MHCYFNAGYGNVSGSLNISAPKSPGLGSKPEVTQNKPGEPAKSHFCWIRMRQEYSGSWLDTFTLSEAFREFGRKNSFLTGSRTMSEPCIFTILNNKNCWIHNSDLSGAVTVDPALSFILKLLFSLMCQCYTLQFLSNLMSDINSIFQHFKRESRKRPVKKHLFTQELGEVYIWSTWTWRSYQQYRAMSNFCEIVELRSLLPLISLIKNVM